MRSWQGFLVGRLTENSWRSRENEAMTAYVMIMPSDGGEATQLTFDHGRSWVHTFSPDGDKIVFAGERNGVWNVYWVSRSSKQQEQLTNYPKLNAYIRYPPGHRWEIRSFTSTPKPRATSG